MSLVTTTSQAISLFKKPSIPKPKPKRKVLVEEEYVSALEKIIVRDFCPELLKLRAQYEYLSAMDDDDADKMREVCMRYNATTPLGTPQSLFLSLSLVCSSFTPF